MKAVFYEIWSNNERRIWKVYTDLTDDVRVHIPVHPASVPMLSGQSFR